MQASIAALARPCSTPFPCVRRFLYRAWPFVLTTQHRIRLFLLLLPRAHVLHKTPSCAEPGRRVLPPLHRRRACARRHRRCARAGLHDPRGGHRYAPATRCAEGKGQGGRGARRVVLWRRAGDCARGGRRGSLARHQARSCAHGEPGDHVWGVRAHKGRSAARAREGRRCEHQSRPWPLVCPRRD